MAERVAGKWTVVADGSVPGKPWYAFRWDDTVDRDGRDFATWREAYNYAYTMAGLKSKVAHVRRLSRFRLSDMMCGPDCNRSHWELRA